MIAYVEDRLPAEPSAVPMARHALAIALLPQVTDELLQNTLLLATEVVSAAIRRTMSPWLLRVEVHPALVKVTVEFQADGALASDDEPSALHGVLLDAMSDGWAVTLDRSGGLSSIWFQLHRAPAPL